MCRCLPPSLRPSPVIRRVGVRISTFEACSSFTRVTARWLAQPPKAAFVTRLRSRQSPSKTARQLPGLSTTPCVEPSSTGDARLRGARVTVTVPSFRKYFRQPRPRCAVSGRVCPGRGRGRDFSRSPRRTPPSLTGGRSSRGLAPDEVTVTGPYLPIAAYLLCCTDDAHRPHCRPRPAASRHMSAAIAARK